MEILPPERFPHRDRAALLAFLKDCRQRARAADHPVLASITLEVAHIDPLGVLDSIFEPGQAHGYIERAQSDEALAGAEAVVTFTAAGTDRFARTKQFTKEVLDRAIAIGDMDAPFAGPHFFSSFTFDPDAADTPHAFAPAHLFIPRWQVAKKNGRYSATANLMVSGESPLEAMADRVWAAHHKFNRFEYRKSQNSGKPPPALQAVSSDDSAEAFEKLVTRALGAIQQKCIDKVVLARALDYRAESPLEPLLALGLLRERYPGCYAFSFSQGTGPSFIGATPEKLFRAQAEQIETEALAGSIQRGGDARVDAGFERTLLSSDKDLREHDLVVESIKSSLLAIGCACAPTAAPRLLKLANVQHLLTPLYARRDAAVHFFDLADALHPTPALGGVPRAQALQLIRQWEGFSRELYGGLVGWMDYRGDGLLAVGIRSGKVENNRIRLYTGAGIVRDSHPVDELRETDIKLQALLRSLQA